MKAVVLVLIAIISYALGNLNGAIITSRLIYGQDVRNYGSGNAGLTNFHRKYGAKSALFVIGIDVGKGIVAALIGGGLMGLLGYPMVGKIFAGFCVILGHSFPVLYGFRGGKGVLTGVSMLFVVDWRLAIIALLLFGCIVAFTRYVSLGSIVGSAAAPLGVWAFGHGGLEGVLMLLCWLLLVFQHRGNIGRLVAGTESKLRLGKTPEEKLREDFK